MVTYDKLIKNLKLLLADDDEDYLLVTYDFLKQIGYNVDIAKDGKEALEKLKSGEYQIALLDYFMPELTGEEVIQKVRETNQELIIVLQTGFSGQKPPIDTMQKLNIQNYYDKTEGIDKLNLELISAVKILEQQNEIELTRYKSNAIGTLISGVAQEIRSMLLSIGAGIDVTKIIMQEDSTKMMGDNAEKLNRFYANNKEQLEKVDKVLTSIISHSQENTGSDVIMPSQDVIEIINLILINESKTLGVVLNSKVSLKSNSYLSGSINDSIFIMCGLAKRLMGMQERGTSINIELTEDASNWYIIIESEKVQSINTNDFYLIKKLLLGLKDTSITREDNKITLSMLKV